MQHTSLCGALAAACLALVTSACRGDDCTVTLTCAPTPRVWGDGGSRVVSEGASGASSRPSGPSTGTGWTDYELGVTCDLPSNCASGFCIDGVCCDQECAGLCMTCSARETAGTCGPVADDTDPAAECGQATCDGDGGCAYGRHRWTTKLAYASHFGGAVDSAGNVYVVMNDDDSMHLARLSESGAELWSRHDSHVRAPLGAPGVSTFTNGDVLVGGASADTVDLGGTAGPVAGDMFVARIDSSGTASWAKAYTSSGLGWMTDVATDASDNILLIGGHADGQIDFDGTVIAASGAQSFWVVLDDGGTHIHGDQLQATDGGQARLATGQFGAAGELALIGKFSGSLRLGSDTLAATTSDEHDCFIAKVSSSGQYLWARQIVLELPAEMYDVLEVDVDDTGSVLASGWFEGAVDFGAGATAAVDGRDFFLARYASDGTLLWSRTFGGVSRDRGRAMFDDDGHVIVTGHISNNVDMGGGTLNANDGDLLVAKLDPDGNHIWSRLYGDAATQGGEVIGVTSTNEMLLMGAFEGTIDFGDAPQSATGAELFVTRLGP